MSHNVAQVVSVNLSTEKGTCKQPQADVTIDGTGLVGDAHSGPGLRQVSLLAQESIERFGQEEGREFKPGDFAENLTTARLPVQSVAILDRLQIGEVALEVTQIGKECHGRGCAIYREVGRCVMPQEGVFTRVLHGGEIRPGDELIHHPRPFKAWVITVSDRASTGQYEDRSGPRALDLIQEYMSSRPWHLECRRSVVPDDPQKLERELQRAQEERTDLVITTGGTGIGPRDITPEVVVMRCSKLIPGVMEHIRTKYGQDKPAALLSRSVAGVMGHGLVYTLPGSVKAVEQYMSEILRTMEHLIYTLHGLDIHN
jgi:molybdenum cofactor synthesis domain-containing protein